MMERVAGIGQKGGEGHRGDKGERGRGEPGSEGRVRSLSLSPSIFVKFFRGVFL